LKAKRFYPNSTQNSQYCWKHCICADVSALNWCCCQC